MAFATPESQLTRFYDHAELVHKRTHGGRTLEVFESAVADGRPWLMVVIRNGQRFEGRLILSRDDSRTRVEGPLVNEDHESYHVRIDAFDGGPLELADLACRLLDYEYEFPPGAGVTADEFAWTKKPEGP